MKPASPILILAVALAACGDSGGTGGAGTTATTTGGNTSGPSTGSGPSATTASASGTGTGTVASTGTGTGPCGDGTCAPDETATSCCEDCGVCNEQGAVTMTVGVQGGVPGGDFTPGGLADTHAAYTAERFSEFSFPIRVTDEPVDGSTYFWAQQFFFEGTTQGGYTGMQAGGIQNGQVVGKMFIFSIWDAPSAVPGPDATCEPFGGEGVGQSCRLAFPWREDVTYRFVLREAAADQWSLSVFDPTLPGERLLGTIAVLSEWGQIKAFSAGFTEYFGQVASCDVLPFARAVFHAPSGDGALPTHVEGATFGPCAAQATSVCDGALCN